MKNLFLLLLAFISAGQLYLSVAMTSFKSHPHQADDPGKMIYEKHCLTCHQADGKGVPGMNPPLTGTDWVKGNKTKLINVVLKGMNTPTEINGEMYRSSMPSHSFLSDKEISEVLTYVRSNFGNKYGPVSEAEVKKVRGSK